jgi:ornithine carbamoyltransferase
MHAAVRFGFELRVACPEELHPRAGVLDWVKREKGAVSLGNDALKAVRGADCVVTDTWVSMGDTDGARRKKILAPFAVDASLMSEAARGAIFMHCLPAYRGREVMADVIDGPQSVVFDEAENRLHAQKAILAWCLGAG